MKREKGAVSVFLVIVLFTTVLLGGLFIDASRILLAKRFVRNAIDSSARSALSYYDAHLASEYGMFAVDGSTAEQAFRRYFKTHIKLKENERFDILRMNVEDGDIEVKMSGSLSTNDAMMDSMEEFSKYRSIVNTTYGVVQKIKAFFGSDGGNDSPSTKVFNAADTGKAAKKQLEDDYNEFASGARAKISSGLRTTAERYGGDVRDDLKSGKIVGSDSLGFGDIDGEVAEAKADSEELRKARERFDKANADAARELEGTRGLSTEYLDEDSGLWGSDASDASDDMSEDAVEAGYGDAFPSLSDKVDEEKGAIDGKISATERRIGEKKSEIQRKTDEANACTERIVELEGQKTAKQAEITEAEKELKDAQDALKQAEKDVKSAERDKASYDKKIEALKKNSDEAEKKKGQFEDELQELKLELAELEEAEERDETAIEKKKGEIEKKQTEIDEQQGIMDKAVQDAEKLYNDSEDMRNDYEDAYRRYNSSQSRVTTANDTLERLKRELQAIQDEIDGKTERRSELADEIDQCYKDMPAEESNPGDLPDMDSVSDDDKKQMDEESKRHNLVDDLKKFYNEHVKEFGKKASDVEANVFNGDISFSMDDWVSNAFSTIDELKGQCEGIASLFTGSADVEAAFFFTDYIFDKCTFLTSRTDRPNRHFQVAEVEYILKGSDCQAQNIALVIKDIALLRLLINWIDYMCTTHSPEIISRMLIALGRAAIRTVKDLYELVFSENGDNATISLCPSIKNIKLTYSDHLRLSMLLRALSEDGRAEMMGNFRKMMEDTYQVQNWGAVSSLNTHIDAKVTVKVDLIMLTMPMFERVLPKNNQILQSGKFLVHESVSLGY